MRSESDQRFVHRLEAFSDIVIGFSLAQLGASLIIPSSGAVLLADTNWLFGFLQAFAVVCSMWYFHHRLFSRFFVPKAWPVVINFVWLAVVILLVFTSEVDAHLRGDMTALRLHFGTYALAYAILGVQYVVCLRYMETAEKPIRDGARRGAVFMFLWTCPFIVCCIAAIMLPITSFPITVTLAFVVASMASVWLSARYRRQAAAL